MTTFTAFAKWPDGYGEQVDVEASSAEVALDVAFDILTEDYEPGWEIVKVEARNGLFF